MLIPGADVPLDNRLGRYRLIAEIARGGMGIVYIAAAQGPAGFSKLVAIKELKPDLVQDVSFLTMFLDEARIAARLTHPNIVQTNDVDEAGGRHFIAMEYLDGRSFYHVLSRFAQNKASGGFPLRLSVAVLRDALSALDYAHELADVDGRPFGFVHRDVSPHNIFLTFDGHTKVIDFGIAKARDSSLETKTGVLKGRVSYMAPEQLTHRADRRSDIFSVGAILSEVVTGRRLWQGMHEMEILAHLTRAEVPELKPMRPDAPEALLAIARVALSGHAEDRYATAAEMRDALDDYLWQNGGAPQARELSAKLLEEFGAQRQKQRELIEKAVHRIQYGHSEKVERIPVSDGTRTGLTAEAAHTSPSSASGRSSPSSPSMHSSPSSPSSASRRPGAVASGSYASGAHEKLDPPLVNEFDLPDVNMRASRVLLQPAPLADVPNLLRKHRHVIAAAAAAAILMGVLIGLLLRRSPRAEPEIVQAAPAAWPVGAAGAASQPVAIPAPSSASASAPGASLTASSGSVPSIPDMIVLSVSVAPASARVIIDGETMPSNPFLGRFPKGVETHRIRAAAPGYVTKERLVSFSENVMVDMSLNPRPPQPPPPVEPPRRAQASRHGPPAPTRAPSPQAHPAIAPAPAPAAPAVTRPADIVPRGDGDLPRRRTIDSNNPYGDEK
jgi:serine/threonine-protein kinase